ncbi:hypothetical protein FHC51_08245 [Leclercia sp. EC_58]|uniref:hypothetical protein n=1 Tax=Leclercia sp. EC_58 TaxID=2584090 RepID=UPI001C707889|nr:hypothetical protein [Leclercia sp. EC_58]MBW9399806.1 hypothetical protein [Leclercia sp. EC_58]
MNIVHISKTPLAGSPGRLSDEINKQNEISSLAFIEKDYPGELSGKFIYNSVVLDCLSSWDLLKYSVKSADIIHIHNDVSTECLHLILNQNPTSKFVYHVHSPLREGPLFFEVYKTLGIDFYKKIVVGQYHPRHYSDFIPLLNIVPFKATSSVKNVDDKIRILFSPSHTRTGGRWNDKVSAELDRTLKLIAKDKRFEIITPSKISPSALFELRKTCNITIDEITTGSYHQISLEGLAAGNVVINNSDFFSNIFLETLSSSSEHVPFVRMNNKNVSRKLPELLSRPEEIYSMQKQSAKFYKKYLSPQKTANRLIDIYKGKL